MKNNFKNIAIQYNAIQPAPFNVVAKWYNKFIDDPGV
jgi:hypothetical protein